MSDLNRRPPRIDARDWLEPLPAATRFSFRGSPEAAAAASRALGVELSQVFFQGLFGGLAVVIPPLPSLPHPPAPEPQRAARRAGGGWWR